MDESWDTLDLGRYFRLLLVWSSSYTNHPSRIPRLGKPLKQIMIISILSFNFKGLVCWGKYENETMSENGRINVDFMKLHILKKKRMLLTVHWPIQSQKVKLHRCEAGRTNQRKVFHS